VNAIGAEKVFIMTEKFTRTPEEIRTQFRDNDPWFALWLVADVGATVVGGASFRRGVASKNAHSADLGVSVRKEFRGLGLGEAMMRTGMEWARSVGVTRLRLGVFATNATAIALYRKLGFVEEGRLRGEVILHGGPVDEVLMALRL
ncbi:MAG: GNAT family N-acetyltransferase, partial [Thermoplasmata archaeon]